MIVLLDIVFYTGAALRAILSHRVRCDACGSYTKPVVGSWQKGLRRCDNCQHYVLAVPRPSWELASAAAGTIIILG